jgi:RAB protein geranylgeranyltransferase component A
MIFFDRLSAVFGGIYALNQPLNSLIFDSENNFKGLVCGKQRITAEFLVMGVEKAPPHIYQVATAVVHS